MFLLYAIALLIIDGENVTVEIVGESLKNRISEFLILQNPRKSQFCKSGIQSGRGGTLFENLCPTLAPRCDFFEVCREKNLAIFEIANKYRAAN